MQIRDARPEDAHFLRAMSLEAVDWRGGGDPANAPELAVYLRDWDSSDVGFIAESGVPIGAAWYRFFTADHPGYGFVAEDIPELGIAVIPPHRRHGVGRMLIDALISRARAAGVPGISLSVEDGNEPAARLYVATGFTRTCRVGNAWTMLRRLP